MIGAAFDLVSQQAHCNARYVLACLLTLIHDYTQLRANECIWRPSVSSCKLIYSIQLDTRSSRRELRLAFQIVLLTTRLLTVLPDTVGRMTVRCCGQCDFCELSIASVMEASAIHRRAKHCVQAWQCTVYSVNDFRSFVPNPSSDQPALNIWSSTFCTVKSSASCALCNHPTMASSAGVAGSI